MQNDEVAEDVAFDGEDEGRARAFQALEQVGAKKPIRRVPARDRPLIVRVCSDVGGGFGLSAT